jgi:pyridoxal phosphate enzyme (YggS family)
MRQIADNFSDIQKKIERSARSCDRMPGDIHLVAVSKNQPAAKISAALETGHRLFGENRVQDAIVRWTHFKTRFSDIRLHLIGPLQSNKAEDAVAFFDVIETIDRPKIALSLAEAMKKQGRYLPCFIQVNTGEELQKAGVLPADLPDLIKTCVAAGIDLRGLMCIPPENEPAALHFAFLAKLAARHGLKQISMGMSGDFEKAIPLGATHVRVGTALFGARDMEDA